MLLKKPTAVEGMKLLGLIILGSALIHFLVIFFLPTGKMTRDRLSKTFHANGSDSVSIELVEIAPPEEEKQRLIPKEEQESQQENLKTRQQFVDTGTSDADEEIKVETEMVGEKGTVARDMTPGGNDNLPKLEGVTKAPSLGGSPGEAQGPSTTPTEEATKAFIAESAPGETQEETRDVETAETSEEKSSVEEVTTAEQGVTSPPKESVSEPLAQEPELAEKEAELEETDSTKEEKLLAQAKGSETQAPVEDKKLPLLADEQKTKDNATDKEESPLEKELEKLEVEEDGLIPRREPHELAYVPPWELRGRPKEATRPKERALPATPARGRPKVAISFNAKTLSGGEIMPMMDAAEANAPKEGSPSFNVKKDAYAPYYKHIRDKISWYWFLGYGTRQEIKLETENNQPIIVEFKVFPEGVVKEAKIIQEAGNHLLASRIKDSIEATRLDRFSRHGINEEYIDVRFNFYFF